MVREYDALQPDFTRGKIPWEWRDPWAWITSALLLLVTATFVTDIWVKIDGLWIDVAIMFSIAADSYRRVLYLRREGLHLDRENRQRLWAIAFLGLGILLLLHSWGTSPWK